MIQIYNDVVEDHVAEFIASEMKNVQWKFENEKLRFLIGDIRTRG